MTNHSAEHQGPRVQSKGQARIALATLLLPWRLAELIFRTERDDGIAGRVILGQTLLTVLFVDLSFLVGLAAPTILWTFNAAMVAYCVALLVFSFAILNALSLRR